MTQYSMPRTMHCRVVDNDPALASVAFALGMYLCLVVHGGEGTLEDEPALAGHVSALARLRKATAEHTVLAEFRDQRGIAVDTADDLVAHSFDSPAGPAVIVAAPGKKARGKVSVERSAFSNPGGPEHGVVYRLDGSRKPATGETREFSLRENEVAVWTL